MPRLLICTPTAALRGGVESILEALVRGLPPRGIEVVVALARGRRLHDPARFRGAIAGIEQWVELDGTSGTAYGRRRAVRRAIEQVDPDLLLNARLFDVYPAAAALKREGHRLRLTTTIQAYEAEYFVDLARYAPFVDGCVTSGNLIAAAVARFTSFPADRLRSIPGGVAAPQRPAMPRHDGPLRLGYVGRLDETQKRVLDLAATLAELRRRGIAFTCVVAGDGDAADVLRARLRELDVDASLLGWLSRDALYERVYPDLDVLLHFAAYEGITIAPREAMAHGVVPVISRFTGLADEAMFVDGENALTFGVGDIGAAADCIARLDGDRALLQRLSEAARRSQSGIRGDEGALDAWAELLQRTLALPQRIGDALPAVARGGGRLSFLPEAIVEPLRRRRAARPTDDPGAEWPHWSGVGDETLMRAIDEFGRSR